MSGSSQTTRPLRVVGRVQQYAWGKVGATSRIANFLEVYDPVEPLAEYWLGAHPRASARVVLSEHEALPIDEFLGHDARLPFMLKVLSINPNHGLSIQAHPDAEWARKLHARDPGNYPDESHKPEVGIALTPVSLLYGFRSPSALAGTLSRFSEFSQLFSAELWREITSGERKSSEPRFIREVFSEILLAAPTTVASVVWSIDERFSSESDVPEEVRVLQRLRPAHGETDPGLLAPFVMNLVRLPSGSGIFIGANIPHAYLDGDLVECMACSDNVIRAGLTPKHKDVETLLGTLSYECVGAPRLITPSYSGNDWEHLELPASEFGVAVVGHGSGETRMTAPTKASIVLCLGSQVRINHAESGESLTLSDGGAALLCGGSGSYTVERSEAALVWGIAKD